MGFIVDFLSFSHFGESMYDPPLFILILLKSYYKKLTLSNSKSDPFIFSCKFSSYFCKND